MLSQSGSDEPDYDSLSLSLSLSLWVSRPLSRSPPAEVTETRRRVPGSLCLIGSSVAAEGIKVSATATYKYNCTSSVSPSCLILSAVVECNSAHLESFTLDCSS